MASSRHEHVAELFPGVSIAISSELAELNLPAGVRRIQQHTLLPSGAPQLAVSPNRQKMAARKWSSNAVAASAAQTRVAAAKSGGQSGSSASVTAAVTDPAQRMRRRHAAISNKVPAPPDASSVSSQAQIDTNERAAAPVVASLDVAAQRDGAMPAIPVDNKLQHNATRKRTNAVGKSSSSAHTTLIKLRKDGPSLNALKAASRQAQPVIASESHAAPDVDLAAVSDDSSVSKLKTPRLRRFARRTPYTLEQIAYLTFKRGKGCSVQYSTVRTAPHTVRCIHSRYRRGYSTAPQHPSAAAVR